MSLTANEIAQFAGGIIVGDGDRAVSSAQPVHNAGPDDLTFASDGRNLRLALQKKPAVLIIDESLTDSLPESCEIAFVAVVDPHDVMSWCLEQLLPPREKAPPGISPDAVIAETATLGKDVTIHAGVRIGENAVIGDRCELHPGVIVGDGSRIGNNADIHPYVVLYPEVEIGDNAVIQAGVILGGDGFGYRTKGGEHHRVNHFGRLQIGDNVEIGAGSTLDRAVLGRTIIGDGTKIGNLVCVAHNCDVGRHNLIVSQVGFAGSVTTGEYVVCAGQVGVGDHVHLGDHCVLAAQAGASRDLPGGQTYFGSPAAPIEDENKQIAALRKLPALRQTMRSLESQLAELREQVEALAGESGDDSLSRAA